MESYQNTTLKSIVTEDFRAAAVFEKYSLDFCCGGGITVDQACVNKKVDPALVHAELAELKRMCITATCARRSRFFGPIRRRWHRCTAAGIRKSSPSHAISK